MYAAVGAAIVVIVLIVSVISVFLFWRRREGKSGFKTIQSQEHVAGIRLSFLHLLSSDSVL